MWLERFSGQSAQSTPSASPNRAGSPAPRRSMQLAANATPRRPGLNPRTSSLSVVSPGGSTDSLPPAAKISYGSSLKSELASSPANVPDPGEVLEVILGPLQNDDGSERLEDEMNSKPAILVEDIDFQGLSLEDFAASNASHREMVAQEGPIIEDFEKEKDKFEDLHKSILACDEVLKSVETYLASFRADLASVSTEIETLQDRSTALNNKLKNRKSVEKLLGPEVEAIAVSPTVVRKIAEGHMDDSWVKALDELEKRSQTIDAKVKEGKDVKAAQDVRPFIDDVSTKAVERIRDYVVSQIKALRSPSINAQVIQQQKFLPYRNAFGFLARRHPPLADEITQAYINTMRWYYLSHFMRYKTALDKLPLHAIDATNTLAADTPTARSGKLPTHDPFTLGRRLDILRTTNETALPSFAAEDAKDPHHLETPFLSYNLALLDNATAEQTFLTTFFPTRNPTTTLTTILAPTFTLAHNLTRTLTSPPTADALGTLTAIRLTQHLAFQSQRRRLPALEPYTNATLMHLWPRFQQTLDAHADSIKRASALLPGKPIGTSALSLTSTAAAAQTTAPHALTQRFAHFVHGLLALSAEGGDDEPVSSSLRRLWVEWEGFVTKAAKGFAEKGKRERFLRNNYELVFMVLEGVGGRLGAEVRGWAEEGKEGGGGGVGG